MAVFTRTDTETDSVQFYNTLLEFLEDPDEQEDVGQLLLFWNQYVSLSDAAITIERILGSFSLPMHPLKFPSQRIVLWRN